MTAKEMFEELGLTERRVNDYCYPLLIALLNGTDTVVKLPKSILTEKEKEYLSYVIRPFRNRIKYICKNNNEDGDTEFLDVQLDDNDFMAFPNFKKGTMYKGMELGMGYTLEELSL